MNKDPKRENSKKGAVTFLDVVGWLGIWQRRPDAILQLTNLIEEIEDFAKVQFSGASRGVSTEILSISDTIVLLTDSNDPRDVLRLHLQLSAKVRALSLQKGIPIRGATSYGEYNNSSNILVGPAIDEAASWHENSEWFGNFLTPSAHFLVKEYNEPYISSYTVPTKNSKKYTTFCSNWTKYFFETIPKVPEKRQKLIDAFVEMGPIIPSVSDKYLNTMDFYNEVTKSRNNKRTSKSIRRIK